MFSVDEIKEAIDSSPSESGIHALFVPLNDNWAIKLYEDEYQRDAAYSVQEQLADYCLAPDTFNTIDLPDCEGYSYGYITEIIEPIIIGISPYHTKQAKENGDYVSQWEKDWEDVIVKYHKEVNDVLGETLDDDHAWNWGTKKGKLMLLDFY